MHLLTQLFFIVTTVTAVVKGIPELCKQAGWTIAGFDVLSKHRGHVTLVAFMPLNCDNSEVRLQKFQDLRRSDDDTHILVVSPSDTFHYVGAEKRRKYTNIKFWIDSKFGSAWKQINANNYDYFLYDRCGRLSEVIRGANTDIPSFNGVVDKIKQLKLRSRCGWCQYDRPQLKQNSGGQSSGYQRRKFQDSEYERIRIQPGNVSRQTKGKPGRSQENDYSAKITQKIPIQQTVFVPRNEDRYLRQEAVGVDLKKPYHIPPLKNSETRTGQYTVDKSNTNYNRGQDATLSRQYISNNRDGLNSNLRRDYNNITSSSFNSNQDVKTSRSGVANRSFNYDRNLNSESAREYHMGSSSSYSTNQNPIRGRQYNVNNFNNFNRNRNLQPGQNLDSRSTGIPPTFGERQDSASSREHNVNDPRNSDKSRISQANPNYSLDSSSRFNKDQDMKTNREYYTSSPRQSNQNSDSKQTQDYYTNSRNRNKEQGLGPDNHFYAGTIHDSSSGRVQGLNQDHYRDDLRSRGTSQAYKPIQSSSSEDSDKFQRSRVNVQYPDNDFPNSNRKEESRPESHYYGNVPRKSGNSYEGSTSSNQFQRADSADRIDGRQQVDNRQRIESAHSQNTFGTDNSQKFPADDTSSKQPSSSSQSLLDNVDVLKSLYSVGSVDEPLAEPAEDHGNVASQEQSASTPVSRSRIPLTAPYATDDVIFCDHVTDERCYQERKNRKDGTTWWKKCCAKGIYLTDVCVPDRCSNSTAQLCCAQKFLQARFRCCNNETQNAILPTDSFSRCCYDNFVQVKDPCCPNSEAQRYWLSNAELCLPNVSVNLTEVVFEARISDTEKVVIRLSDDKSWDYKCAYGTNVMQFVYLPDFNDDL